MLTISGDPVSFFHLQFASKWYACFPAFRQNVWIHRDHQIIKEQLTFPSGTATAQLISVLHQLPPPDTSVRRRHRYMPLDTGEDQAHEPDSPIVDDPDQDDLNQHDSTEREVVQQEGWQKLVWSFFASSIMTVSANSSSS